MMETDVTKLTPSQLRSLADAAERKEKEEAPHRAVAEADEKMKGKCFRLLQPGPNWGCLTLERFTHFRVDFGRSEARIQRVGFVMYKKPTEGISCLSYGTPHWEPFADVASLMLYRRPVDEKVFLAAWKRAPSLLDVFKKAFTDEKEWDLLEDRAEPVWRDEENLPPADVPHIVVPSHRTSLLPARYFLPGGFYVLCPASRAAGLRKLAEKANHLAGGYGLYQECDMRHVHAEEEAIRELRAALS